MRALTDFVAPFGVRELPGRAGVPASTLSRVIGLLERDGIVERDANGRVRSLDWEATLRRWD